MPLRPRFRRVAALERRFVNRESVLAAFAEELSRVADQPRVLNVVGVGGIGKSRLVRELRNRAAASQGCRTAVLDLQVAAAGKCVGRPADRVRPTAGLLRQVRYRLCGVVAAAAPEPADHRP
ncbi:MAG TPA: AAA family ATPase [Pseudonocardiaceae bacterium]|nr:AAA family ATPase [Pseudonocardiaceae bacterium]